MTFIFAILFAVLLLIIVVLIIWQKSLSTQLKLLTSQHQAQELLYDELQTLINQQQDSLSQQFEQAHSINTESEQISRQLEHRIKNLQQQLNQQLDLITQLQQQQPEDKLYSRALKLVALGADVEEVMRECEMPRVEAELLFSIHQKAN